MPELCKVLLVLAALQAPHHGSPHLTQLAGPSVVYRAGQCKGSIAADLQTHGREERTNFNVYSSSISVCCLTLKFLQLCTAEQRAVRSSCCSEGGREMTGGRRETTGGRREMG